MKRAAPRPPPPRSSPSALAWRTPADGYGGAPGWMRDITPRQWRCDGGAHRERRRCARDGRGVLDFTEPRQTIGGVMDHQILAGILAADFVRVALLPFGPRANFDGHGVGFRVVADHWLDDHGSKVRSPKALWTVSPSASVTTRGRR